MEGFRKKWTAWPIYRRAMLAATVGLMVLATVLYLTVGSRQGVEYRSSFYALTAEDGTMTYTANAHEWREGNTAIQSGAGRKIVYTVTPILNSGFMVTCRMGEETYGPYQVAAVDLAGLSARLTEFPMDGGMEITNVTTGERLFRGGYIRSSSGYAFLLDETAETGADSILDYAPPKPEKGPNCDDLYHFTFGAEESMTSRADWTLYFYAFLLAAFNAASILCAEEFFTWSMSFRVADPANVEPSEWELFTRHVGWAVFLFFEVILLLAGILSGT